MIVWKDEDTEQIVSMTGNRQEFKFSSQRRQVDIIGLKMLLNGFKVSFDRNQVKGIMLSNILMKNSSMVVG